MWAILFSLQCVDGPKYIVYYCLILMAQCKAMVTPLLMPWSYRSLALSLDLFSILFAVCLFFSAPQSRWCCSPQLSSLLVYGVQGRGGCGRGTDAAVCVSGCEGSPCRLAGPAAPGVSALRGSPSGDEDWDPSMDCGSCDPVTPNPTVASACPPRRASPPDVMQSSQSDTCSDVSTLPDIPGNEESWLVTPPPCFTAGPRSPLSALETSSMENLLIEHPSMSVYASRGRQNSEGVDSTHSDSDEETSNVVVPAVAARGHTIRQPPRRPHAVAERAGLTTSQKVALQQYKTRSMTRSSLKRQNLVCQRVSRNKAAARRGRVVQPCPRGQRHC